VREIELARAEMRAAEAEFPIHKSIVDEIDTRITHLERRIADLPNDPGIQDGSGKVTPPSPTSKPAQP
jgi:hypothetical protein